MDEYTIPEMYPFDPDGHRDTWIPAAYDLASWPQFEEAPVGSHQYTATVCALYRFYDENRRPLYIGVTKNPAERWDWHRGTTRWFWIARFVSLEPVAPATCLAAEQRAINAENPRYNRTRSYKRSTRI